MKHYTDDDIAAFIDDGKPSHPKDWFFARDFWLNRAKDGLHPDQDNPHYAGLNRCWGWNGRILGGYGVIHMFDKTKGAHRVSYEIHHGPIPDGMVIRHRCDNKICTNPEHLEAGTSQQNIKDAHERGLVKRGKAKAVMATADKVPFLVIASVVNSLDRHLRGIMRGEEQARMEKMWSFQDDIRALLKDCFAMANPDHKYLRPKKAKIRIESLDIMPTEDEPHQMLDGWMMQALEGRSWLDSSKQL